MKKSRTLVLLAVAGLLASVANAQDAAWPTRPVRLVVPWGAGGSTDMAGRAIAQKLSERWGQQVIVENKPGGNSIVGASEVARAAPDGYTLLLAGPTTVTANQFLYSKLPYDPARDFTLLSVTHGVPLIVMGSASLPVKTLPEAIELAKKNPDTVTFGSAAGAQIQTEQWMRDWGVKFRYVMYKSAIDVTRALLSGEIQLAVDGIANNLAHIQADKIRGLAVNTNKRMPMVANVPTMDELKIKHTEPQIWHGLVAPAGLPAWLQTKINADVQMVLAAPDVNDKLGREMGLEPLPGNGPQEFAKRIQADNAVVGPLVKELGLKLD